MCPSDGVLHKSTSRNLCNIDKKELQKRNKEITKQNTYERSMIIMRKMKVLFSTLLVLATMAICMVPAFATSNKDRVYNALVNEGLSSAAACGIMANIEKESSFNPSAGSSGGAYGLCQWTGSRKSNLYSYCSKNGYSSSSVEGQVKFLMYELRNNYSSLLNTLKNVGNNSDGAYNAGYRFCYDFERPANKASKASQRGSLASSSYWPSYKTVAAEKPAAEATTTKTTSTSSKAVSTTATTELAKIFAYYGLKFVEA